MHATIFSGTIIGIEGLTVEVEVDLAKGLPCFSIVGLPNTAVRESRERVTAAIKNSGFKFPLERITVNLAPADIKKEGAVFDLAIAVGIVLASSSSLVRGDGRAAATFGDETIRVPDTLFLGELALEGSIRRVRGVLPVLLHAKSRGFVRAVVPYDNFPECLVVDGLEVIAFKRLSDVLRCLRPGRGGVELSDPDDVSLASDVLRKRRDETRRLASARARRRGEDADGLDMADVAGQEAAKRALLVAAAGGHHVLMTGPPGAGKTMLARRFPSILPPLDEQGALETTMIYSIAGLLDGEGLVTACPFRSPHHSASDAGLIGGGNIPRPGEVTLAHNGVLFLDELPEFRRHVLETLREPLEEGRIAISRARSSVVFPARFQLIAAMNPCPCGHLGNPAEICRCAPLLIERYLAKISGPLLDRIAVHVFVRPVELSSFGLSGASSRETSAVLLARVVEARERQKRRLASEDVTVPLNARMPERLLRRFCRLGDEPSELLARAQKALRISARGRSHILRVARTIADLEGAESVATAHVAEAVQYRVRELRG